MQPQLPMSGDYGRKDTQDSFALGSEYLRGGDEVAQSFMTAKDPIDDHVVEASLPIKQDYLQDTGEKEEKSSVKASFEMPITHVNNHNLLQKDRRITSVQHEKYLNDVYDQV